MAQARRKRNDTRDGRSIGIAILRHVKHGLRESAFLLLGGVALVLMIAIASYDPADPAWTHTGRGDEVVNLGGVVGAWFADIVLYFFGYLAFLIPVGIAFAGWRLFRHQTINELDAEIVIFRSLGTVVAFGSGCGLASLHIRAGTFMHGSAGGIIGDLTAQGLVGAFSPVGGTLFLLALFFAGLSLATGVSWLAVIDFVGKCALLLGSWVRTWVVALGTWLAQLHQPSTVPSIPSGDERHVSAARPDEGGTRVHGSQRSSQRVEPSVEGRLVDVLGEDRRRTWEATPADAYDPGFGQPAPAVTESSPRPGLAEKLASDMDSVVDTPIPLQRPATNRTTSAPDPLPHMSLLDSVPREEGGYTREALDEMSRQVETLLRHFGIEVRVVAVEPGPVITRFELDPAPGVKVSQISNLAKDLARGLSVISVRVVEVIPGKSVIGLEIPNQRRETVYLSELLNSPAYARSTSAMTLALGKDIGGNPVVANLAKMPHLLVAGTTGSGKSVAVNAMLLSLLYKARPDEVRLILVDPKMLELSVYEDIPHLLAPVVTDMKEAANALRWCVGEMERRYRLMAALKVRNIAGYNRKLSDAAASGDPIRDPLYKREDLLDVQQEVPVLEPLPFIVVVIDELADMMMIVGKKVEELIARLAQKARASGIHLILATQRPSVDVITGLIKANIPTRIAFQVSSKVDSRTILDQMGAEQLLGHGDMLYLPPGSGFPQRMHGAFVQDHEVNQVVEYLKQTGTPDYLDDVLEEGTDYANGAAPEFGAGGSDSESDPLYDQAVQIVTETRRASISGVQRRLKIGYNRAARMIEEMESAGIVGPLQSNGGREVLAAPPPDA